MKNTGCVPEREGGRGVPCLQCWQLGGRDRRNPASSRPAYSTQLIPALGLHNKTLSLKINSYLKTFLKGNIQNILATDVALWQCLPSIQRAPVREKKTHTASGKTAVTSSKLRELANKKPGKNWQQEKNSDHDTETYLCTLFTARASSPLGWIRWHTSRNK